MAQQHHDTDIHREVAVLMATAQWKGGRSVKKLAKQFNTSINAVYKIAHDVGLAASLVRGKEVGAYREQKLAELDQLKAAALNRKRYLMVAGKPTPMPDPDYGSAVRAIHIQLEAMGALHRHESKSQQPENPYAKKSPVERIKLHEEAIAAERAQIEREARH